MSLYAAAPVLLSMHAGRMADRLGYHRPVHIAIGLSLFGALLAVAATFVGPAARLPLLCASAVFVGSGANMGLIVIQRLAGHVVSTSTERMRMFSWLGIAPSLSNVVGPVAAGFMIDAGGFRAAYTMLFALPLLTLWSARVVPREAPPETAAGAPRAAWGLLWVPGMRRLLFVNWLLSTCWDVHAFAVPILGHERGFTASTIGLVLGTFTLSVSAVRLVVPLIAHHLREVPVLRGAMLGTAAVFALYPLAQTPGWMALAAALLGITLGCVQPMLMSTLHRLTPDGRHGEALAFRSMTINAASTLMPLLFGAGGAVVGAAGMFWLVGAAVGAGSWATRRLAVAVRT
jgi:MFS family permease